MDIIHILSAINFLNKDAYERCKKSVKLVVEEMRN